MKTKIVGILVCMVLIAATVLSVSVFTIDTYESGLIQGDEYFRRKIALERRWEEIELQKITIKGKK